jgi:hypothetical protein
VAVGLDGRAAVRSDMTVSFVLESGQTVVSEWYRLLLEPVDGSMLSTFD